MASNPPRHPLRDLAAAQDDTAPTEWVTGVVVQHTTEQTPYAVRVRLASGATTEWVHYLGWWSPRINDVVHVLRKGPALFVLGPPAPANLAAPPAPVVPPVVAAPPASVPAPRTVPVAPIDRAYWSAWGWKVDDLVQGGPANRALWWYGDRIAAAKGAGTITGGTLYLRRAASTHGVNGPANVRLGVHGHPTRPTADPGPLRAVALVGTLLRGQDATVTLTAAQVAALDAQPLGGLGLEPGAPTYAHPDYLRVVNDAASGQLALTVQD